MADAVRFWIARELVQVGLFLAALLAIVTVVFALALWEDRKRARTKDREAP